MRANWFHGEKFTKTLNSHIPPDKFQEKLTRRVLENITHLNKNTVVHLMHCIEKLKDDIQEEYHEYIF